ncbi:MAG: hypothetical protein K0R92_450 [Lachnospiraceae bacterium]|nr:hypothetical protein [Lachnospiraceae bacterium]
MTERELMRIKKNREKLKALKAEIDDLSYKSLAPGQQLTGMPFVSGTSDKVGDYVTRITTIEDKYISLLIKTQELEKRAKTFIRSIPDDTIQSILYLRYINGADDLIIADAVGMKGNYRESLVRKIVHSFFLDILLYL